MSRLGVAPLALQVSPELRSVEPGVLRARAATHAAEAEALTTQAVALRAAVVRLVPAAWAGLGSWSFASSALLQAGALEAVAAACTELGGALSALAGALDAAKAEAAAATRGADRFDAEILAADRSRASRPEPERPDLDPAVLDARAAVARGLSTRLLVAEESARRAWRQATAAFDLVAYRMPTLSARMHGSAPDGWRPSASLTALPVGEWRALVGPSPLCQTGGYGGAGALLGPDGRRYPLVVPWLRGGGAGTDGDSASLGGADPGWHEIGVRLGIDEFGPPTTTATKAAIVTAGFAGNAPRLVGRLRPDLLPQLLTQVRWTTAGVPTPASAPSVPAPRSAGTAQVPRSAVVRDGDQLGWTSDTSRMTTDRAGRRSNPELPIGPASGRVTPLVPNVVGLTDSGLTGLGTARRMDDSRVAAYRATFEENDDGRIRARVITYQILDGRGGRTVLARDVSMQPDGGLRRDPVT